jgi:hypothetical protein
VTTIPEAAAEVDAAWIEAVLANADALGNARVASVVAHDIGRGVALISEVVRFDLTFDGTPAHAAPASVVVKVPTRDEINLMIGRTLGFYEREVAFYRDREQAGAAPLGVRIPRCYVAEFDPTDNRSVVVLEWLGGFRTGDQDAGMSIADAERLVDALALMHARWWESPELDGLAFLNALDAPDLVAMSKQMCESSWPVVREKLVDSLGSDGVAHGDAWLAGLSGILDTIGAAPHTLLHYDPRGENVMFGPDGEVALVDWQAVARGRGASDLAYGLGSSLNEDDQDAHVERLLRRYHDALVNGGVHDYAFENLDADFRELAQFWLASPVTQLGSMDTANERGARIAARGVERAVHLARRFPVRGT